jgi:putative oxidoreductase
MMDLTSGDLATLVLRLGVGVMILAHAYNKVFGPGGLEGTARWFEGLGVRPGALHARMAATTETVAGVLMIVGVGSPAVCAGLISLMFVAARTDHRGKGVFVFAGGWEYVAFIALVCVAIASAGPGKASLDAALGLEVSGVWYGVAAALIGIILGQIFLQAFRKPEAT